MKIGTKQVNGTRRFLGIAGYEEQLQWVVLVFTLH